MSQTLKRFWTDESGIATVEYAVLLGLMSVSAVTAWEHLGEVVANIADEAATEMETLTR